MLEHTLQYVKPPTVGGLGQLSMPLGLLCLVDPPSHLQTYVSLFSSSVVQGRSEADDASRKGGIS